MAAGRRGISLASFGYHVIKCIFGLFTDENQTLSLSPYYAAVCGICRCGADTAGYI